MMLLVLLQCLINLLILIMIVNLWWTSIGSPVRWQDMKPHPVQKDTGKNTTIVTESRTDAQHPVQKSEETPCAFIKHVKILTKPSRKYGQLSTRERYPRSKKQEDIAETTKHTIG